MRIARPLTKKMLSVLASESSNESVASVLRKLLQPPGRGDYPTR